jgi:hypothetical protein
MTIENASNSEKMPAILICDIKQIIAAMQISLLPEIHISISDKYIFMSALIAILTASAFQ